MSEYYAHVRPKMSDFDVQVRVDVISTKVIVGTQINVDDLSKERHFLRFRNAVTIKTNLAYAMIRCANIKRGDLVVDMSCCTSWRPPLFFRFCLGISMTSLTSSALLRQWHHLTRSAGCLPKANQVRRDGRIAT